MIDVTKYPPNVGVNDCVILFDGVCKLCNVWSQFIIKVDIQQRFKLCSVQSPEGQNILRYFEMPTDLSGRNRGKFPPIKLLAILER